MGAGGGRPVRSVAQGATLKMAPTKLQTSTRPSTYPLPRPGRRERRRPPLTGDVAGAGAGQRPYLAGKEKAAAAHENLDR